jgi:hypothetical protein
MASPRSARSPSGSPTRTALLPSVSARRRWRAERGGAQSGRQARSLARPSIPGQARSLSQVEIRCRPKLGTWVSIEIRPNTKLGTWVDLEIRPNTKLGTWVDLEIRPNTKLGTWVRVRFRPGPSSDLESRPIFDLAQARTLNRGPFSTYRTQGRHARHASIAPRQASAGYTQSSHSGRSSSELGRPGSTMNRGYD